MANSKPKAKAVSKEKKPVVAVKKTKTGKVPTVGSIPGENEIRIKAQEIYSERISKGENGTAEDDWLRAERLLKG